MARGKKQPPTARPPKTVTATVVPALEVGEDTPTYYINYAELNFTSNDFTLNAARMPARLHSSRAAQIIESGRLVVDSAVQLVFSPNVVPALISALTLMRKQYEEQHGPLKDVVNENDLIRR